LRIHYFGHACFLVETKTGTLVTDPFDQRVMPDAPKASPDVVTVSHEHFDHNAVDVLGGCPKVVKMAAPTVAAGFRISGVPSFHDDVGGSTRGPNMIFIIEAEGLRLVHLGDLGHQLSPEQVKAIGRPDVLFLPVGGTYTVDAAGATRVRAALEPKLTIPMHYKIRNSKVDISTVDGFMSMVKQATRSGSSDLNVTRDTLPLSSGIVVMECSPEA
jgi:L-ascorbate metabolism protein UlaG (beta-lactamase superfamily)